jgi:hypothetical protein
VGEKERDYVESLKAKRQELYKEIEDIKAELAAQQKIPDPTRALERSAKRIREDVLKDRLAETIASREAIGDELSKIQAGGVPQIPERSRLTREKQRLEGELGTGRLARDTTTRMQKELEEVNRKLYELNKFQETMPSPDAVKRSLKGEPGDDWLAKASADYATKIAAASAEMLGAGGAQDPELFAKQQARIEAMTKLKEELDALRESIRKNREEYDKKEKEKWDNPSMFAAQDRFDRAKKALNNIPDTATFDEILPLSKEYQSALQALNAERSKSTVSGSMDGLIKAFTNNQLGQGLSEAARMLGPLLNMAGAGIMNMTGEQPDYKIPATETIMANSKEAAEFMKKIWQEEHLPASAQTDAQQNAAVRNKLLEILPRINDYLRKIAGAEGV